jgi:hypothetical protein
VRSDLLALPSQGISFKLTAVLPLIAEAITAGASRVATGQLCLHAVAITPAGPMELVRSYCPINGGPPT